MAERPVLLLFRKAPHGTIFCAEGFRLAEALLAFEMPVNAAFVGDGVHVLHKGQGGPMGLGDLGAAFARLPSSGLREFLVSGSDLRERGLSRDELIDGPIRVVDDAELKKTIDESKAVMPF